MDHMTDVCLVAWPLNESEAGVDIVFIWWKPLCCSYVNDIVLMLISRNLYEKNSEVSIKRRSTPASLSCKGQGTKHTTVNGLFKGSQSGAGTTNCHRWKIPFVQSATRKTRFHQCWMNIRKETLACWPFLRFSFSHLCKIHFVNSLLDSFRSCV